MGVQANTLVSVVFYMGLLFLFLWFLLPIRGPNERLSSPSMRMYTIRSEEDGSRANRSGWKERGIGRKGGEEEEEACIPNCKEGAGKKREFHGAGTGAYLFIQMSAYRGGPNQFFINGLGSKPVHVFSNASFQCEWIPNSNSSKSSSLEQPIPGHAHKTLPDWGFGRVYTTIVVMCTFDQHVGTDLLGGHLVLYASPSSSFHSSPSNHVQRIIALTEAVGEYNPAKFDPPYPFEYVYCGSPLYGDISPQRIREWVAYHLKLFGPRSHLVLYDAGGIHPGVQRVLEPWVRAKRVSIENVRMQEEYDGYYHNQFLVVNDCLHKTRFMANWTFFFDVDEFLYLPENSSLESLLQENSRFTQIFFEQMPMSHRICIGGDSNSSYQKMWGFEKLVFKSVKKGVRLDRKYAVQPRNVFATGVHLTMNFQGKSLQIKGDKARYYHYHGTTSLRGEVCQHLINVTWDHHNTIWHQKEPFIIDLSMHKLASDVKNFEFDQIGEREVLL